MNYFDVVLIGAALSMDAFGVTLTNGMLYKDESLLRRLSMPLCFGVFQAAMPLIGFYAGSLFAEHISGFTKPLLFGIFLLLALKMLWDGIKELREPRQTRVDKRLLLGVVVVQALLTSIDALAVGVGFCAEPDFNIWLAATLIGLVTFVICAAALLIGRKFGDMLGSRAPFAGAAILIFIAFKTLLG